jgi:hypothetical protein
LPPASIAASGKYDLLEHDKNPSAAQGSR